MATSSTEFQHFIPQFLLKNYAYPFTCPEAKNRGSKKCRCRHEKGKHPGDLVVNCVNLSKTPFLLEVHSVKRIFGAPAMYHNPAGAESHETRRIETMFGKMESQASTVFRRIVKSHEAGDSAITLTRIERDLVRKFLFLLKYRGSTFHQRFYHDSPEDYQCNDRERLLEYMRTQNFSSPRDVWFHNLEVIMNLKMDPQCKWIEELPRTMFPDDARWFIAHAQIFYMAICATPATDEEFILTDNGYNVFEGPNNFIRDSTTGEITGSTHASYHEFAPISPRLMVVLRSRKLPIPEEDLDPEIFRARQDLHWATYGQVFGTESRSVLEDLPIRLARNSYCEIVNGRVRAVGGYDGIHRSTDVFLFAYHRIESHHVQEINNIFLENLRPTGVLAFRTQESFLKTVEAYVCGPCEHYKIVAGGAGDAECKFLRGLEALIQTLGSQKLLVWRLMPEPIPAATAKASEKEDTFLKMMYSSRGIGNLDPNPAHAFFELHSKLEEVDGAVGFLNNLAQAGKMLLLWKTVGVWTLRCSMVKRVQTLSLLTSTFRNSHCARFWIYLKLLRKADSGDKDRTQDLVDILAVDGIRQGPEDVFAKTSHCYNPNVLKKLMHLTVLNDSDRQHNSFAHMWMLMSRGSGVLAKYFREKLLTSDSIRCCGIRKIERLAERESRLLIDQGLDSHEVDLSYVDDELRLELMTRVRVKPKFRAALSGDFEHGILSELEDVFFNLTYPAPRLEGGYASKSCI